jgi:hypothetical protein
MFRFVGCKLLEIDSPLENIRIMLEEYGAEVLDEDVLEELPILTGFMLLTKGQHWIEPSLMKSVISSGPKGEVICFWKSVILTSIVHWMIQVIDRLIR